MKKIYLILSVSLLLSNLSTNCIPTNLYNRLIESLKKYKETKSENILNDFLSEYYDLNNEDQDLIIKEIKNLNIIVPGIVEEKDIVKDFYEKKSKEDEKKSSTKTDLAIKEMSQIERDEFKKQKDLEISKKNLEDATAKNKELSEKFKVNHNKNQELLFKKQDALKNINEIQANLNQISQSSISNTTQKVLNEKEIRANALLKNANKQTESKIQELKMKKEELEKKLANLKKQ